MAGGGGKQDGAGKPDADWVRAHLKHVLAFGEFAAAPQLSAFLNYIVERKLEGAEDRIKAYTIATEALGRPASFDPQSDPIVRVQARRLRQALLAYYAQPDADDTLRIVLPVGGYVPELKSYVATIRHGGDRVDAHGAVPVSRFAYATLAVALLALTITVWSNVGVLRASWEDFTWNQPETEANPLGMPALVVTVASERQIPGWFSPQLFAKGVESNLSKFDEFAVLAPVKNRPLADTDYRLDLVFTGSPSAVLGTARLMRGSSGEIVWANRFTVPEDSIDSYEVIDPVRRLSATLGQPYGVLYSQVLADPARNADQVCLLSGYEWFQVPAKDSIEPIRLCLLDILKRKPGNHVAHMMLAYVHVARFRWGVGEGAATELAQAFNMAKRAIALRPESAGTHQAMMEVQWAREKFDLAEEAGRSAVALNPNSSDVIADFGCRLIYKGKYSEGETYAQRAARWNSQPPVWHQFCLFLAAYNTQNFEAAKLSSERLEGQQGPEAYVPVILMAARAGDTAKARTAYEKLLAYDASYAGDPGPSLEKIGLFPQVAKPLIEALKAAVQDLKV
jgi:hypothetical protein